MRQLLFTTLAAGIFLGCSATKEAGWPNATYTLEDAEGSWFGFAQGDVYLYRIRMFSDHTGDGAVSSEVSGTVSRFTIKSWDKSRINNLSLVLLGNGLSRLDARFVTKTTLLGQIYGTTGWSNSVCLYKEEEFEHRMDSLREAMPRTAYPRR